ncbi:hypothetical protein TrVGV298_004321 [Trichoderma virens]|nr:hypothetical protein TrVGV298_004321 [Trichoderma virens]
MVHFNLELIWLSRASPHVDLVFVHGYGGNPETTWHDESTGKIWIKDEEFITRIKRPIRIFSFSYNGDVEANLSSSSPAFHASDLLCCLEQALERSAGRPLIFIAHGFGGIIVKKAIQLCFMTPTYPRTKNALAGVVFFGTPHADTDSEALLQSVRGTIDAFGPKDGARSEDVREFVSIVSRINTTFIALIKPRRRIWNKIDDDRRSRERQKKDEDSASREHFLRSLSGWSDLNYGNEVYVAAGTCEWFKDGAIYKNWLTDPKCGTIFYLGAPGHGKSHLARAVYTHLKSSKPEDVVMSYFCQKGEEKPAIWEYFTWKLIKEWPDWFLHVPIQFRRKKDDPNARLDPSAYAEIWTAFRKVCSPRTVYLIVDGLEQTPSANFTEFFALIEHLRQLIVLENRSSSTLLEMPTKVKLVITSRWTDAAYSASSTTSCCTLPDQDLKKDVATYLDKRFLAIFNTRQKSDQDLIQKIKEQAIQKAGAYWLYAKLAADEIERLCSLNPIQELQEDYIPTELAQLYEQKMLPLLQSANNSERHLRTVLTLIASEEIGLAFSIKQLDSILECLYGQDDMPVESLAKSMQLYCGDLFWVSPADSLIFSVHASVRSHLSNYLSLEHRQTNMAFICLTYLLQDRFSDRLPLSWTDREGTAEKMAKTAAFYGFASQCWLSYLPKLKTLSPQLIPLLQKFLSLDCPQYQTWLHWKSWLLSEKSEETMLGTEDPIMAMWPDITGLHGHTLLMAAALSGNRGMVEHILQWNVDLNARDEGGRTALTLCLTSDRLMGIKAKNQDVYNVVETLLLNGVNPNISDDHGITPLHVVSVRGRYDLARLLLRFNALVNITDSWGFTPLERAYSAGNIQLVTMLIDRGADAKAWMLGGEPPLARCIFDGKLDMFKAFLPFADINQTTMLGFAPIHLASDGADRIEFLRVLLSRPGLDLNAVSSLTERFHIKRTTAIGFAINSRNYAALEWLLEAGAYPGLLPMVSVPPLHDAVIVQDKPMVELLLFYGAPVNDFRRSWFPYTALGHAVDLGLESIVELLLQNGADASIEEGYGVVALVETAVTRDGPPIPKIVKKLLESRHPPDVNYFKDNEDHCIIGAVDQGDVETVSILLEHGADMSIYLTSGERVSPLHKAARKGNVEMCDILLKHEPKLLDLQLEKGFMIESPLFAACHRKQKAVVRFLLDKGAKVDQVSHYYKESPLFTACDVGDLDIVKMILEAAPHMINVPTVFYCTPLAFACSHGNLDMVKLLIDAGAEMYLPNGSGTTSAFSRIFEAKGDKPFKTLQLLLDNGLDLHALDNETGLTVLGWAIIDAEARHVKWLLEHGADPLRAQRGPGGKESWRTALQVATHSSNKNILPIIDLLLEPRWGLWDHLTHRDYQGGTLLPVLAPLRKGLHIVSRILSVCDTVFKETGNDVFSAVVGQPSLSGLTPVDCAMGNFDAKPEALPDLDKLIVSQIDELLAGRRSMEIHLLGLDYVAGLLFSRGGYDADARVLVEFILTRPQVRWDDDGYYMGSVSLQQCFVCDKSIYDPYVYCTLCENSWCSDCKDKDMISLHQHKWFPVEVRKDLDINAPDIQETLERLHKQLTSSPSFLEEPQQHSETLTISSPTQEEPLPAPAQASLPLATLHAFNFLAITRPIWTPFLPLSLSAQALVDPWHALWSREDEYRRWRSFLERRNMNYENSAWRRFQELRYLRRGFTRAYTDGERVKQDLVLYDIRQLYDEKVEMRPARPREKWLPVVRKKKS